MIEASIPELADGGCWYVVEVVPDPVEAGFTPGYIPGNGWCAWYSGNLVAVRTPEAVSGVPTVDAKVSEVISGVKPRGRIGGR